MKTLLSAAALAAFASTGFAQLPAAGPASTVLGGQFATAAPMQLGGQINSAAAVYSGVGGGPSGYLAFPPATGAIGFDDYTSISSGPIDVSRIRFVGGVDTVGGVVNFQFFDAAGASFLGSVGVALPQVGNFIWTIDVPSGTVLADASGLMQISVDAGANGQFFLSDGDPVIGSQDFAVGGASGLYRHCFEVSNYPTTGGPYCFGDGIDQDCPCANIVASGGTGCANSTGAGGVLSVSGSADTAADTFTLNASGLPASTTALFFQGPGTTDANGVGKVFGDGLRCVAGGGIIRLETVLTDASGAAASSVSLSAAGGVVSGDTRHYQCWYRDVTGPCGSGSNTTNAYLQTWQ
jgi:hypothetical protein